MKELAKTILYEPLYNALMFLVAIVPGHSVGIAIILLTLIIRIILYPSTKKSLIAQKRMRNLQPKMQEIKQKHKGDAAAQNSALMELYKQEKVNPLGSCLPLVIQLPIFFVLYKVFINGLDASRFSLLYGFVPVPDTINTVFLGIDLAKKDLIALPIITAALQFWQSKQLIPKNRSAKKSDDMSENISRQIMYTFPIIIFFTSRTFPAALPLYWSANSLFSIVQQWWLLREKTEELSEKAGLVPKEDEKDSKISYSRGKDTTVTIRKKNK